MNGKAGNPRSNGGRAAARTSLVTVVVGLAIFALFGNSSIGALAQVAPMQTTETPSEEPSESPTEEPTTEPTEPPPPTGPQVVLLNPALEYGPGLGLPEADDTPRISDQYDGVNETFHVVAVTKGAPDGAIVEAYWTPDGGGETSVGRLDKVDSAGGTWEMEWDIPETLSGHGTFTVKLFNGGNELDKDSEVAEVDPAEQTVEIVWPSNGGRLGWFKPKVGKWRAVIEGTASVATQRVYVYYTVTPLGKQPVYKGCAATPSVNPPAPPAGQNYRTWFMTCELAGKDLPSQVTGVAAVAAETDSPVTPGAPGFLTNESSDAHRVTTYLQQPGKMSVSLKPVSPTATSAAYPTADAQQAGNDCLEFDATVVDQFGRPVQGANVDVHLQGPSDEVGIGDEGNTTHGSSTYKPPDAGAHEKEDVWDCDSPGARWDGNQYGEHEAPTSDDQKHSETAIAGSGLSGPSGIQPGQFRFHVFSPDPGRTKITAWVDERPVKKETALRAADNDKLEDGEPRGRYEAQWLAGPARVRLSPASSTFITGECSQVTVSIRGGRTPVEGANVDVHATGPTNDLDFCVPPGGSDMRAPDQAAHDPEDEQEGTHPGADAESPSTQHTEGETDQTGTFVIGLLSPADGNTTVQAWVDGSKGSDNDARATTEPTGNGNYAWASDANEASVTFLNPSGYGEGAGDNVSTNNDGNGYFHIVTRVDLPDLVNGVEILLSDDGTSFSKLGNAVEVGNSGVYEYKWVPLNIAEDSYVLRARIEGTERFDDREINIDNSLQTLELSRPALNSTVSFIEQKATVAGTASAEAEGVTFYYTQNAARDPHDEASWTECGRATLEAPGDAPQAFEGECTLAEGDQAGAVTGIAAIADICDPLLGCDDTVSPPIHESGDAHRAFGLDSTPIVGISPLRGEGSAGTCQRIAIDAEDQAGGPVPNADVDVHIKGPSANVHFCDPEGSFNNRDAPEEGEHTAVPGQSDESRHSNSETVHTEGKTGSNGRFVVGILSGKEGTSRLTAWIDQTENDVEDADESSVQTNFRWVGAGRCTKSGTSGRDVLRGTPGKDRLCGLGGNDVLEGLGGNDVLIGGPGRDIVRGQAGNDQAIGRSGDDSLVGGPGDDTVLAGKGQDVLSGKGGRDTLRGGAQNDNLKGGGGKDSCYGNTGRDRFTSCERRQQ